MESLSNDFSFTSLSVPFSLPVVLGNKVLASSAEKDDQRLRDFRYTNDIAEKRIVESRDSRVK